MAETIVAISGGELDDSQDRRVSQHSSTAAEAAAAVFDTRYAASGERRTLTDIEVAARLGVSRFTVRSWRLKGIGPRFLKMGRAVRYRPEDVQEYEQRVLVNPASR
jgi:predicted DNA-binding transcriptional regulator AlpA